MSGSTPEHSFAQTALDRLLLAPRPRVLAGVALLIAALVILEWTIRIEYSLGVLYILPMILGGVVLNRLQTVLLALFCAFARGLFTDVPTLLDWWLRFAMASLAYTGAGLFILELRRNRQMYIVHLAQLEEQERLRHEAEEQLRVLAESSPAAIMTLDERGEVLATNHASLEMLGLDSESALLGESIGPYLPLLADVLLIERAERRFRTAVQCWGRRKDGSPFLAQTWFSTYLSQGRRRLAAIAVDTSEEMRDREEQHLEQLARNNRILAGAVSHEIRNLCAAVNVVSSNLSRQPHLNENPDFQSLQALIEGLSRLASFDLRTSRDSLASVNIAELLDRFSIISRRSWEDAGGGLAMEIPEKVPPVAGDANELLQVLLNLSQNSLRAAASLPDPLLIITVSVEMPFVRITIADSGPGVADPSQLFQAFRSGSGSSGLGLYVSRALVRNFGGELRYLANSFGRPAFVLELIAVEFAGK